MQRLGFAIAVAAVLTALGIYAQQRSGTTMLTVRVDSERHLSPESLRLNFVVSADGSADLVLHTVPVRAWVRALPGQNILLTARVAGLPAAADLRWSGATTEATGGAQNAVCTSGAFRGGAGELVANWTRSGILNCSVTFRLANPRDLEPGSYPAAVTLALRTE